VPPQKIIFRGPFFSKSSGDHVPHFSHCISRKIFLEENNYGLLPDPAKIVHHHGNIRVNFELILRRISISFSAVPHKGT
jgi:hypothetical protein